MLIVYASKTGNIERFVKKNQLSSSLKLTTGSEIVNEKFILITYTTGLGEVPTEVTDFLKNNNSFLIGVIGSGNIIWGEVFCNAAKIISNFYKTPLLMTFELSGHNKDIAKFQEIYKRLS